MVEEILNGPVVKQDVHQCTISGIVRTVDPLGVLVVSVAIGGGPLACSTGRGTPADKGTLKVHRVSTEHLVRSGRDAVLWTFHNFDAECRVKGAAEVIGHREDVVINAGLIQDDVAVIRIKVLAGYAGPRPIGTICIQANGGRERRYTWNQCRVQIESPLKNVPIVDGQIVDD